MAQQRRSLRPRALAGVALAVLLVGAALGLLWDRSADAPRAEARATTSAREPRGDQGLDDAPPDGAVAPIGRATVWVEVVSDEGSPVPGAVVTLHAAVGAREQRTDEAGLTRFEGLLPGPYTVDVAAAGYQPRSTQEALRPGLSEAAWTLRVAPQEGSEGALRGLVVSERAPVAGALVTVRLPDGRGADGAEVVVDGAVRSDEDGRFVLATKARGSGVVAFHPEHGVAEVPLADASEVVVELPSPGFVEGRVTDDAGRPLEAFRVRVVATALPGGLSRALAEASGGGRQGWRAARRQLERPWERFPAADSDDEAGRFRLGPVPAGLVRVVASAEGRAPSEAEVRVPSGGTSNEVTLALAGPLVVTGCVTDAKSGEPVRGARVHAVRTDAPSAPGFGASTTGDDGCYRLLTAADVRHSVGVRASGYVAASVGGVLGRADDEVRRDFSLERSRGAHDGFRYVGIGAKLKGHGDGAEVVDVFSSGSAAGALQKGDVILRVEGVWTEGLSLARIVEMIVGEDGTEVELLLQPKGGGPVKTVVLPRRQMSSRG